MNTVFRLDFIVNWHVSIQISLEFYLSLRIFWFLGEFLKICLKIKDVKENPVQWTHWDSNRECLKFDKVGKHSSSANKITANNYKCIILGRYTARNSHSNTSHYLTKPFRPN